jgi:16S rRNA processing protein RimM
LPRDRILLGVIGRPHGIRGLVRVISYAADPAAIAAYGPLCDAGGRRFVLRWRGEGIAEIAELADGAERRVDNRTAAEKLTNTQLFVDRGALPDAGEDEFYLADLAGLVALDVRGLPIGEVTAVHDYGAGASLEITRPGAPPLLVPFTRAAVPAVDIPHGCVTIAPPEEIVVEHSPLQAEGAGA